MGDPFCCGGCARVYELLQRTGLDRYYDLRGPTGTPAATFREGGFTWLDPLLPEPERTSPAPVRLALDVQGIHCAACVWLLRELFLRRDGGIDLKLNPSLGSAEATFIPSRLDIRAYLAEAEAFGYRFGPRRKEARRHSHGLLLRMAVCAAAAMNVMIFSVCYYAGLAPADGAIYRILGQLSLVLTSVAVLTGGTVFIRSAVAALRRRIVHLDLPIALGIVLAFAGSIYAYAVEGPQATYFDTVASFITLMLVGRWLQERVLERNRNSLLESDEIEGLHVRIHREGRVESAAASRIVRGDEIWIVPGDIVPVEGIVLGPACDLSLDWITGESDLRSFAAGDRVPAGAFNAGRTTLRLAAEEDYADSRLHDLLRAPVAGLPEASRGASAMRWWHRLGTIYVIAVLVLAGAGFAFWIPKGIEAAMKVTVAILVVTCPCAIGLATPLAQELIHMALRRRGVFVRNAGFLDRALGVRRIVFDKTGTLTLGDLVLTGESQRALARLDSGDRRILHAMAARSNHPSSRALTRAIEDRFPDDAAIGPDGADAAAADAIEEIAGRGLEWLLGERRYSLGRSNDGNGTCFAVDGCTRGIFAFDEQMRPDAAQEVERLSSNGYAIHILSGDAREKTARVAEQLSIDPAHAEGGCTPEAKAQRIRELGPETTLMVGDGINDAPSFEVAACTATPAIDRPAMPARADLYFLGEGIAAVRRSMDAARRLRGIVVANLGFALCYNAIALALCFTGLISPLVAAVLMPLSSLTVVAHTILRLSGRRLAWMS